MPLPDTVNPPSASAAHVLVVDDQAALRDVVRDVLEINGCLVAEASTCESAKALIGQQVVDVVVADIYMDGGQPTGVELIAHIRRAAPATRIVAVSGGGDGIYGRDALQVALDQGADIALAKPFSARELLRAVVGAP